jgi:hypothetical protein
MRAFLAQGTYLWRVAFSFGDDAPRGGRAGHSKGEQRCPNAALLKDGQSTLQCCLHY